MRAKGLVRVAGGQGRAQQSILAAARRIAGLPRPMRHAARRKMPRFALKGAVCFSRWCHSHTLNLFFL